MDMLKIIASVLAAILVFVLAVILVFASPSFAQSLTGTNESTSQSGSASSIQRGGDNVKSTTAIAPSGNNTAPCVLHPSFGVGIAGYGVSKGLPYVDKKCLLRLEAQMLAEVANLRGLSRTAAIVHLANDPDLHRTMVAIGWLAKAQ